MSVCVASSHGLVCINNWNLCSLYSYTNRRTLIVICMMCMSVKCIRQARFRVLVIQSHPPVYKANSIDLDFGITFSVYVQRGSTMADHQAECFHYSKNEHS
jgi:hypothetical protein